MSKKDEDLINEIDCSVTPPPSAEEEAKLAQDEISRLTERFQIDPETDTKIQYRALKKWMTLQLVTMIQIAMNKVQNYCRPKSDRLHYSKLIGYYIQILNSLLKEEEMDSLSKRTEVLELAIAENRKNTR